MRWSILLFLLTAVSALVGCGGDDGPAGVTPLPAPPKLTLDPPSYDFGEISLAGAVISHRVILTNTGGSDLLIDKVAADCGCLLAEVKDRRIAPGESIMMELQLDTQRLKPDPEGLFYRRVFIRSNDPSSSQLVFEVTGKKAVNHFFYPPRVAFDGVMLGSDEKRVLTYLPRATSESSDSFVPTIETTDPRLSASIREVGLEQPPMPEESIDPSSRKRFDFALDSASFPRRGYQIDLSLTETMPAGVFHHYVTIQTGDPHDPVIMVPVDIALLEPLVITPRRVYWGVLDLAGRKKPYARTIVIDGGTEAFKVLSTRCESDAIQIEAIRRSDTAWKLKLRFDPSSIEGDKFTQLIEVSTDHATMKKFTIGCYGTVLR